jgi:hypothetical protein
MELLLELLISSYHNWWAICTYCDLTGTTIAENAAGVATLAATLSTATTEATLVSLEYTGTATNGTDYVARGDHINPAGDLEQ